MTPCGQGLGQTKRTAPQDHPTHLGLGLPLATGEDVAHPRALALAVGVLEEFNHLAVVGGDGAVLNGRHGEGDVHARVVVLSVVVDDGALQAVRLEHRERLEGFALAEDVRRLEVGVAGEEIVQLGAGKEVGDLPVGVDGEHDREGVTEVRGGVEERLALVEGFADELVLLVVEFKDGLLEVPDAAVDELCRLGRRACGGKGIRAGSAGAHTEADEEPVKDCV